MTFSSAKLEVSKVSANAAVPKMNCGSLSPLESRVGPAALARAPQPTVLLVLLVLLPLPPPPPLLPLPPPLLLML